MLNGVRGAVPLREKHSKILPKIDDFCNFSFWLGEGRGQVGVEPPTGENSPFLCFH